MILAGGIGERLYPLTANRSKPAVPFGGSFRIIDFTLLNCISSGYRRIHLLTQYHAHSLNRHCAERWRFLSRELGEGIELVPPRMRVPSGLYRGTADAIYRNLDLLDRERPDVVLVLSGDHVYRADYSKLVETHIERDADVTVLTDYVDVSEASSFGIVNVTDGSRIAQFVEKPADPTPYAIGNRCLINLGVYVFRTEFLARHLVADARKTTSHDFGKNILPSVLDIGSVLSCPLEVICPDSRPYWRDVGSIDSYFQANMDLLRTPAEFDLEDPRWLADSKLREWLPARAAATLRRDEQTFEGWNLIANGARLETSRVIDTVVGPRARIGRGAEVEQCILFPGCVVGEGTRLRRVIVEEGVHVPPGLQIGHGEESTQFTLSKGGITVIGGNRHFDVGSSADMDLREGDGVDIAGSQDDGVLDERPEAAAACAKPRSRLPDLAGMKP